MMSLAPAWFASWRTRLVMMKTLKLAVSPAALCIWAICLIVGYSIVSSNASAVVSFRQENRFGYTKTSFPLHMKRWDEALFALLSARNKTEMAEFLKTAEQDANAQPIQGEWKPYTQTVSYFEQFRTASLVSYLEVATVTLGDARPTISFRTVTFDRDSGRELVLADIVDGATDRSPTLEALSTYARADLKEETGEDEESDTLLDMTKPDLSVYERFTFCPSTKTGKAAGLTIHFPPSLDGPYAGSDFHVTIPYTVFAKYLKPKMKALFSGEPRATQVSLRDLDS